MKCCNVFMLLQRLDNRRNARQGIIFNGPLLLVANSPFLFSSSPAGSEYSRSLQRVACLRQERRTDDRKGAQRQGAGQFLKLPSALHMFSACTGCFVDSEDVVNNYFHHLHILRNLRSIMIRSWVLCIAQLSRNQAPIIRQKKSF